MWRPQASVGLQPGAELVQGIRLLQSQSLSRSIKGPPPEARSSRTGGPLLKGLCRHASATTLVIGERQARWEPHSALLPSPTLLCFAHNGYHRALGLGGMLPEALLHLLLLYGLVVSTALIWHPINKLAAVLLLPYLAWLTVTASIAYRLWRDSLCPNHQPQPMGEKSD
ncbi:translocator protein 2 isoform X3 [Leptonychotes weddellii]|uniref:Translocator protein 2 isoform X3 n=1 Tax=Leptonychotes weddellii TaxID=9713 RepID=A0A7F8Q8T8_LEPWE|nr:translocator protein 2 isoform X3 [Leptonychotes weddellii]XP_035942832.1 translocator protein 2 isoform X2 [Halichoerus grypus]